MSRLRASLTGRGGRRHAARGFSLVELMIGLLLGLGVIAAILSIVLASRQSYRLVEAQSELQDVGRYVLGRIAEEASRAGHAACYPDLGVGVTNLLSGTSSAVANAGYVWSLDGSLQGFDNLTATTTVAGISGFVPGTDALLVKGMADNVTLSGNPDGSTFTTTVTPNRLRAGQILVVADCSNAAVFQASAVSTTSGVTSITVGSSGLTPGNSSGTVAQTFGGDAEIGPLDAVLLYIKSRPNGRRALYHARLRVSSSTTAAFQEEALVDGVDDLQLAFGVDTDNDREVDTFQVASAVSDWGEVISVRVAVLASSVDNVVLEDNSYSFNATTHRFERDATPSAQADRRLRRTFNSYVAARNRIH